ncbi:protein male-specific lethal-1 [Teleopsis dalmanni]|uniref:protein male-specific lethal-1 n=1 Tax=Teleopsis dalmanni TaxID=139649 RepID=UPI0018CE5CF8|nr:protein male-specific lethal-1 [Teleopsis dalmanni]
MMENKCNKTPNCNNKYMDHVYCHSGENRYIRSNNNNNASGGGNGATTAHGDILALFKENKQLKSMLILHLDLIQEQTDQLMAKDKQIESQNEELIALREKCTGFEAQVQDLQTQLQRQLKRNAGGEVSSIPPPPLAKIQRVGEQTANRNIIGECNGKLISKIILHRVNVNKDVMQCTNMSSTSESDVDADAEADGDGDDDETEDKTTQNDEDDEDEQDEEQEEEAEEAEEETEDQEGESSNATEDSNDTLISKINKKQRNQKPITLTLTRKVKPNVTAVATPIPSSSTTQTTVTQPPSRGKQMPVMLWHANDMQSDESGSCESVAGTELNSPTPSSIAMPKPPAEPKKKETTSQGKKEKKILAPPAYTMYEIKNKSVNRSPYISTEQRYCTREWETETVLREFEYLNRDGTILDSDVATLEIPKWSEIDLNVSYNIEGTEDLSDETYLKRHAKLEADEKRRKKWDVQQIREQRRIEKLKRRHCKDELNNQTEQQAIQSFYPKSEEVETICYINSLPVQAFGEMIPKLNPRKEFKLPWLSRFRSRTTTRSYASRSVATLGTSNLLGYSAQAQQQVLTSSYVYIKKRKRQQSSTTRQRNTTASTSRYAAAAQLSSTSQG